jgi:single-strand DNA-binding protein
MSFIQVNTRGNLTADPELRYTKNENAVCNVRLAAQSMYADRTTFVNATLWGRDAEIAAEYLSKGSPIEIIGAELQNNDWETEDGDTVRDFKLNGGRLRLLPKSQNEAAGSESSDADAEDTPEDEVPF